MGEVMNRAEVAQRCVNAKEPDRELDVFIWALAHDLELTWQGTCLVAGLQGVVGWIDPGKHSRNFHTNRLATGPAAIPAYTASIDAAETLVPEGYAYGCGRGTEEPDVEAWAWCGLDSGPYAFAANPALALCAACLALDTV